jgi:mRNA interferase RelE/StbE
MSVYTVYVTPTALKEIKDLPGHMRQRVKRAIDELDDDPHPAGSKRLEIPETIPVEVWRIRLEKWRIVYMITEIEKIIDVVAVRRRPPYDYGDVQTLLNEI